MNYEIKEIHIEQVYPSKDNPRKTFDEEKLEALKGSIQDRDLTEPISIRKGDNTIIKGHRRYLAEKALGAKMLSVRVYDVDENRAAEMRLEAEEDLTQSEKENGLYERWQTGNYASRSALARAIGWSGDTVANLINAKEERLSSYEEKAIQQVATNDLIDTQQLKKVDPEARKELLKHRASNEISQRELRELAKAATEFEKPEERKGYIQEQTAILRDQKAERERASQLRKESAAATKKGLPPTIVSLDNRDAIRDDKTVKSFEALVWRCRPELVTAAGRIKEVSNVHKQSLCLEYVKRIYEMCYAVITELEGEVTG